MATVGALLPRATEHLRERGSESARLDAEVLLAFVLATDRTTLLAHPEMSVVDPTADRFRELVERRAAGEPVAYIRGLKEFFGLAFAVDARALIPRPETERLVEAGSAEVLARLTAAPPTGGRSAGGGNGAVRIVDVGTGSGAVAISLAVELRRRNVVLGRDAVVVATDSSVDALDLARENAVAHAVGDAIEFVEADLLPAALSSASSASPTASPVFDIVMANLPYVRSDAVGRLPVAASFEPRLALDGGSDGLRVIRRLLARLPDALDPAGVALLEIGADQAGSAVGAVADLLPTWQASIERDLAGLPRVLRVVPPAESS